MSRIVSFLSGLKLSVTEWLAVMGAAVVGGLVVALKVQGGRLHRAQVALLDHDLTSKQDRAHEKTADARGKYQEAIDEFLKAGGTLILAFCLACGAPARSESPSPNDLYSKCQKALSACVDLAKAQDAEILVWKDSATAWKKEAEKNTPGLFQSVPWLAWVLIGGVAGAVTVKVVGR